MAPPDHVWLGTWEGGAFVTWGPSAAGICQWSEDGEISSGFVLRWLSVLQQAVLNAWLVFLTLISFQLSFAQNEESFQRGTKVGQGKNSFPLASLGLGFFSSSRLFFLG